MGHYAHGRNGGHAGGHLRDPFCEWVETGEIPAWAEHRGEPLTVDRLVGLLWNCSDIMPSWECGELNLRAGSTYAQGARVVQRRLAADRA
jgi:hypothetical protein